MFPPNTCVDEDIDSVQTACFDIGITGTINEVQGIKIQEEN